MPQPITLTCPHHDPDGRLYDQTLRVLPRLSELFATIAIHATTGTQPAAITLLRDAGAQVVQAEPAGYLRLGVARRGALELALTLEPPTILLCDFDRMLHWAEYYPDELVASLAQLASHDCTVIGRSPRAFASHPQMQRDPEATINHVFASLSGLPWDITAAARGLSRQAAAAIVAGCPDETIGTDGSWPLFLLRRGGMRLGYLATEGMEFETPDRFPVEVAAAGGRAAWVAQLDTDPQNWAQRRAMARATIAAMIAYTEPR